jgi:CRISPR-associated endonuclease/helicase Cas3
MTYIAHSKNYEGKTHALNEHLKEVANLMNEFAINGYKGIFNITGLLHDLGKYQNDFQHYINHGGRRGSVPHAKWGAAVAKKYKLYESAFAIDGHHKGLPDFADLKDDIAEIEEDDNIISFLFNTFLLDTDIQESELKAVPLEWQNTERDLFIRYLFSALTDADWLDTEKHFNPEVNENRKAPNLNADLLINKIDEEIY